MDGIEATKRIKSIRPDIKVVMQTAFAIKGDRAKALEAGCDEYLTQPINSDELLVLVNRYLSS